MKSFYHIISRVFLAIGLFVTTLTAIWMIFLFLPNWEVSDFKPAEATYWFGGGGLCLLASIACKLHEKDA